MCESFWIFYLFISNIIFTVLICPTHPSLPNWLMPACLPSSVLPSPSIPAEADLLVEHQSPLQGPAESVLEPALAAEHGWQADGRRHIARWSALPQVRQEKARPGAFAHCVQSSCRLPIANVAHSLSQIRRVTELLQFEGGERCAVMAAAVEDCWEVAVGQCCFTQLQREKVQKKKRTCTLM